MVLPRYLNLLMKWICLGRFSVRALLLKSSFACFRLAGKKWLQILISFLVI